MLSPLPLKEGAFEYELDLQQFDYAVLLCVSEYVSGRFIVFVLERTA
jgi:hypothetical protein